ncbi:THAP domain-containing protein 2 [Arapaima gigas]
MSTMVLSRRAVSVSQLNPVGPPSADCCPINRGGICGFSSGSPSTPSCFDLTSSTVSLRGDAVSTVFNATGSRHREVLLHLMSRSSADQETPAPLGDVYGDRSYCFSSTSAAKAKIRERRADLWWRETGNLLVRMRRRKCVAVSAGLRCSEERPEQQGPRSPEDRAEEQRHSGHLPHFVQLCSQALLPDPQPQILPHGGRRETVPLLRSQKLLRRGPGCAGWTSREVVLKVFRSGGLNQVHISEGSDKVAKADAEVVDILP